MASRNSTKVWPRSFSLPKPSVKFDWGIKGKDGIIILQPESEAKAWAQQFPETYSLVYRVSAGEWKDSPR